MGMCKDLHKVFPNAIRTNKRKLTNNTINLSFSLTEKEHFSQQIPQYESPKNLKLILQIILVFYTISEE